MINIDNTKEEVAWELGFIGWSDVEKNVLEGTLTLSDFNNIVTKVAKRYSRSAEKYYLEESEDNGY